MLRGKRPLPSTSAHLDSKPYPGGINGVIPPVNSKGQNQWPSLFIATRHSKSGLKLCNAEPPQGVSFGRLASQELLADTITIPASISVTWLTQSK